MPKCLDHFQAWSETPKPSSILALPFPDDCKGHGLKTAVSEYGWSLDVQDTT